ncbi:hypothetical protein [Actinoplanes utahensis]|nr:hypothetical protein [Actinoplanes utahensis]GIF31557.1 hypothetical protein Aut01nite_45430 [Actinoplanes utahensis]
MRKARAVARLVMLAALAGGALPLPDAPADAGDGGRHAVAPARNL